ncbi:MAG: hypothetical protein WAU86_00670 [Oricola sp.]
MAQDIIDAEFETIRREDGHHPVRRTASDKPALQTGTGAKADRKPEPRPAADHEQIGILKSAPGQPAPSKRAQILYALTVLFSSIAAFLVSGGHVLLRAGPAAPQALALEMAPDQGLPALRRGDSVVTVSATIRNPASGEKRVPDVLLTFASTDGGAHLVYRGPRGELLAPGKTLAFTVRMPKKAGYDQAPRLAFDNSGV